MPPLGEAELSDGEGDDIVTLEDCFEVETTPGGTLSFEDSSENILELNNVTTTPSDDVAPLKGNKPFVQLIHTDTRIFRSTNKASKIAYSSGGHERESTRAKLWINLCTGPGPNWCYIGPHKPLSARASGPKG